VRQPIDWLPVVAVCGSGRSGKTTLLEALIPRLVARGLRVAAAKHDAHAFTVDRPGKDSDRLFRAGADVVLQSSAESVQRWHGSTAPELTDVLRSLAARADLVVVEGHRSTALPKIWLLADGEAGTPPGVDGIVEVLGPRDRRVDAAERVALDVLAASWARRPVLGGVLIGGESRRMGRSKQLLRYAGATLLERAVEALQGTVEGVVLLGEGERPRALDGLRQVPDPPGLEGPVAGLLAALRWSPEAAWVILSCDLPLVTADAVDWLLEQREPGRWAVLPRPDGGRVEPLCAVYEPQSRELLEGLVARGGRAPRLIAERSKVVCPAPPGSLAGQWFGVNTPADYEALGRRRPRRSDDSKDPGRAGILDRGRDQSGGVTE
jgi:molybdopterin-guanine dinucleotide biosynthesis protein MobB